MSDKGVKMSFTQVSSLDDVKYFWRKFAIALKGGGSADRVRFVFPRLCMLVTCLSDEDREDFMDWLGENCTMSVSMKSEVEREVARVFDALGDLAEEAAVSPSNCSVKRASGMLLVDVPAASEEAEARLRDAGMSTMRSGDGELYVYSSSIAAENLAATN